MAPLGTPDRSRMITTTTLPSSPLRKQRRDLSPMQATMSLGVGSLSPEGSVTFAASPTKSMSIEVAYPHFTPKSPKSCPPRLRISSRVDEEVDGRPAASKQLFTASSSSSSFASQPPLRTQSSFIRVADLCLTEETMSTNSDEEEIIYPNYHHAAADPPPGVAHDPKERWVALNDSYGTHAPIAPMAVMQLAKVGYDTATQPSMFTPDSNTKRLLSRASAPTWIQNTFQTSGKVVLPPTPTSDEKEVFVWTGGFSHGFYGSDLPCVRSCGVVDMSARNLMELLVDSDRAKEYNKYLIGRTDILTFQNDMTVPGAFGKSITKVMKTEVRPPMIRKNLEFVSVLHAKELDDGSGYLIVTRAVHTPEDSSLPPSTALRSEILMGVNLLRKIQGSEDSRCLMINVNHLRSPMVPMMIAKKLGLSSAVNFLNDIRGCC
jgi:hypothetical protein